MKSRLDANREIITLLTKAVEAYPDWRFTQLLQNLSINVRANDVFAIEDRFYEESNETLDRVNQVMQNLKIN